MSDNDQYIPPEDVEAAYTVNLKTSAEYDSGMLTIRAMDAEQLKERLAELTLVEAIPAIIELEQALQAAERATRKLSKSDGDSSDAGNGGQRQNQRTSSGNGGARSQNSGGGSSNDDVVYHPEGLTCEHTDSDGDADCGERVQKKVIKAKSGKTYKMWVCPRQAKRDDGHWAEFIN